MDNTAYAYACRCCCCCFTCLCCMHAGCLSAAVSRTYVSAKRDPLMKYNKYTMRRGVRMRSRVSVYRPQCALFALFNDGKRALCESIFRFSTSSRTLVRVRRMFILFSRGEKEYKALPRSVGEAVGRAWSAVVYAKLARLPVCVFTRLSEIPLLRVFDYAELGTTTRRCLFRPAWALQRMRPVEL